MNKHMPEAMFALTVTMGVCFSCVADAKLASLAEPKVSFHAVGTAGMKIDGSGGQMTVVDDGTTIKITVPLDSLGTGIGLRDSHMKKYLEASAFPTAELRVTRASLKMPPRDAHAEAKSVPGTLALHGKTKPVSFEYSAQRKGNTIIVDGTMGINVNDYGVTVPSYLGITVKPDVTISAHFSVQDG